MLFFLVAACTAAVEPAANPVAVERPTQTSTVPATETPLPTLTPAGVTPFVPKVTMTPYTPMPTNTPTPTPQSFYEDVWVGGFLMSHNELQVGNSSIRHVLDHGQFVPLQTADEETAVHLNSLPTRDVLVIAEGDFYYNSAEDFWLIVKTIELVNLPYSAEIPLDATYTHTNPYFTFDYPAGCFIHTPEDEAEGILQLNNVPPIVREQGLWVGREFVDPTQYDLAVHVLEVDSIEDFVKSFEENDGMLWEAEMLELNGRPVTKAITQGFGTVATYAVEVNGQILAFTDWMPQTEFMERIVATVR
jgi:hypothetical protein